jgi:hypothetical protein
MAIVDEFRLGGEMREKFRESAATHFLEEVAALNGKSEANPPPACQEHALTDTDLLRRERGLSIEWCKYPRADIEVFYDSCAVLYRIDGKIYVVPRRDVFAQEEPRLARWIGLDWAKREK